MRNVRWWVAAALVVAAAAFLSGLVRGITGTAPFEVEDATASPPLAVVEDLSHSGSGFMLINSRLD